MRTIGVLGFLVLGACTASMSEPIGVCEREACEAADSDAKVDFDRRRVIREGDPAPPFTARVHRAITWETSEHGTNAQTFVGGIESYPPRDGVYCSVYRTKPGTLQRTSRLYLGAPYGDDRGMFFDFLGPNPEGLDFIACVRVGRGDVTYADMEAAFYSAQNGAKIAFEPISEIPYDSQLGTSEEPTLRYDASPHCEAIGARQPWTIELEALLEQGYGGFDPNVCYWAANAQGAVRFSDAGVREEERSSRDRDCFALCIRGYASSIEWGEHRAAIEAAIAERGYGAYGLLRAERTLRTTEGFTRVVDVQRPESARTFDIYYSNEAGDRCARIHVDGYDVTTELDVCGA